MGRIIDADVDRLANIDRLTAQVARLQESLTTAEQEREYHNRKRIEAVEEVGMQIERARKAEQRVVVLETAIEDIDMHNRRHEDRMDSANEFTRAIRDVVNAALYTARSSTPLTGAELAAKMGTKPLSRAAFELNLKNVGNKKEGHPGWCNEWPVARDASVDAPWPDPNPFKAIDMLQRELAAEKKLNGDLIAQQAVNAAVFNDKIGEVEKRLAAANEEIARLKANVSGWVDRYQALQEAHAATTPQLGRAIDILNDLNRHGGLGYETHERILAILADADCKAAGDYVSELEAAVEAARFAFKTGTWPKAWHDALATVDSKRKQ